MSFSIHLAKVVADQMNQFATMGRSKRAGHIANLDFWLDQSRHALEVIDGQEQRYQRLKSTDSAYLYKPVSAESLDDARSAVTDSTYRFLVQCYQDGHLSEDRLRAECDQLGIGVRVEDLVRDEN